MLRKMSILILLLALGLSAELWVNAIRDPAGNVLELLQCGASADE